MKEVSLIYEKSKKSITFAGSSNEMTLSVSGIPKFTSSRTRGVSLASGVKLTPSDTLSSGYLVARIEDRGDVIGSMIIATGEDRSVAI